MMDWMDDFDATDFAAALLESDPIDFVNSAFPEPVASGGRVHGRGNGPIAAFGQPSRRVRTAGEGLGTISDSARREQKFKADAIRSFAVQLYKTHPESFGADPCWAWNTLKERQDFVNSKPAELEPTEEEVRVMLDKTIGLSDKRSRCSHFRPENADFHDPIWAYKPENYFEAFPPLNGFAWRYATHCFKQDGYESDEESPYDLSVDAFGESESLIQFGDSVANQHKQVYQMTYKLILDIIAARTEANSLVRRVCAGQRGFESFCSIVSSFMETGRGVSWLQRILNRYNAVLGAESTYKMLQDKVHEIHRERDHPGHSWLIDTGTVDRWGQVLPALNNELYEIVFDHLDPKSACALMRSECNPFSNQCNPGSVTCPHAQKPAFIVSLYSGPLRSGSG